MFLLRGMSHILNYVRSKIKTFLVITVIILVL